MIPAISGMAIMPWLALWKADRERILGSFVSLIANIEPHDLMDFKVCYSVTVVCVWAGARVRM